MSTRSDGRRRTRGVAPTALAWLLLAQAQRARGAVSSDDLLAWMGGTATGQTLTTAAYSLTMLANSTDCIVSMSYDGAMSDLGWLGWGTGTGMTKADIVVLWPNSDSSWTLSHRNAASTVMPTVVDSTSSSDPSVDASGSLAVVASLSSSSSSDSPTVVTFSRRLTMPSDYSTDAEVKDLKAEINQPIIYALGPTNPGNSDPATDIEQHSLDSMGATYMDLSATFSSSSSAISAPLYSITGGSSSGATAGGSVSSAGAGATTAAGDSSGTGGAAVSTGKPTTGAGAGAGTGASATATDSAAASSSTSTASASTGSSSSSSSYATIIKYHAFAGAAAWLFAAPMGVLIARLGRHCLFFPWHWGFQVFVTTVLTTIAVGLAFYSTKLKGGTVTKDAHVYLGFGILFLVYTQCGIGLWIHLAGMAASAAEKARGRAPRNWLHIGLGITLLIAGFVQIKLGMTKYGVSSTSKLVYAYWGAIALFSVIYLISALLAIANPPLPPKPLKKHHHHEAVRHHRREKHHHHRPVHHSHRGEREREREETERRRKRRKKAKKRRREKEEEKELMSSDSDSTGSGSGSWSGTESESGSSTASSGRSRSGGSSSGSGRRRRK